QRKAKTTATMRIVTQDSPKHLLLVEDNAVNQRLAIMQLQRLGYTVDAVTTGVAALEAVKKISYDLVLMDCQMPEMDGFEATRQIRKGEAGTRRHIPIVALTANAMEGDRRECLAAGMDDYLAKPLDIRLLAGVLRHWVGPARNEVP